MQGAVFVGLEQFDGNLFERLVAVDDRFDVRRDGRFVALAMEEGFDRAS